jgi:hypothetical protein
MVVMVKKERREKRERERGTGTTYQCLLFIKNKNPMGSYFTVLRQNNLVIAWWFTQLDHLLSDCRRPLVVSGSIQL